MNHKSFQEILDEKLDAYAPVEPQEIQSSTIKHAPFNTFYSLKLNRTHFRPSQSQVKAYQRTQKVKPKVDPFISKTQKRVLKKEISFMRDQLNAEQRMSLLSFEIFCHKVFHNEFYLKDIKKCFRERSRSLHPDLNSHLTEKEILERSKEFIDLKLSYEDLLSQLKTSSCQN